MNSIVEVRHKCCGYCGCKFDTKTWPRQCWFCKKTTWVNPLPVGVLLVPVEGGVLLVKRNIEPAKGELALPGGFLDCGETWQEGSCRELFEETNIKIDPNTITLETVISSQSDSVLIFGRTPVQSEVVLKNFVPNDEVSELVVVNKPIQLVWSSHQHVLHGFFNNRRR